MIRYHGNIHPNVRNGHIEKLGDILEYIVAGQKSILDMKWKQRNADVVKGIYQVSIYLHTAHYSGKSTVDRITCSSTGIYTRACSR
jgi:hypothetical protein